MIRDYLPLAAVLAVGLPFAGAAQTALPLDQTQAGVSFAGAATDYRFQAAGAGFLSVVVRGTTEGADLVLSVMDAEHQTLWNGRSDQDLGGDLSAEQLMVPIPSEGFYVVTVEGPYSSETVSFDIAATFLATEMAESKPDPDGKPSQARPLEIGSNHEDEIDPPSGDGWDWYSLTATARGVLTVLTRATDADEGDVKLELFTEDSYREAAQESDQDQDGVFTNESVNVDVIEGQTVYVRVSPALSNGGRAAYRIASGLIPG
jgi:hypothetical protein